MYSPHWGERGRGDCYIHTKRMEPEKWIQFDGYRALQQQLLPIMVSLPMKKSLEHLESNAR